MFSFLTAIFLTFILLIPLHYADEKKKKVKVTTMNGSKYYKAHDIWFYLWYALAFLPIFFVSAFRDKTVGSDNRGIYYSSFIESTRGIDDNHFELGFKTLVKVIAFVTDNYQWFDIITSFIILGLVFYVIERDSKNIAYSYLLFVITGMYVYSLSGIRQYVAIAIMLAGFKYIFEKKLGKYILCIVFASLFHTGILVAIVLYFLVNSKKRIFTPRVMIGSLLVLFVGRQIVSVIIGKLLWGTRYYGYLVSISSSVFQKVVFILQVGILVIMMLSYKSAVNDKKYMLAYWSQSLSVAMVLFTGIIPEISRVAWYFMAYQIVGIPVTMTYVKKRSVRIIWTIGIVAVHLIYFVYDFIYMGYYGVFPYTFCFFK